MTNVIPENQNSRDIRFDILKAIGLFCIILAHTISKENLLFQFRNFDVPLMVIVSGALFYYSCQNKKYSFWNYVKRRIPRLMAPVWCFLVFFFSFTYLKSLLLEQKYPFSSKNVIESFLLLDGIGYVWIIRVFVAIAILSPLLLKLRHSLSSNKQFLECLSIIYITYEILVNLIGNLSHPVTNNAVIDWFVRKIFFIGYYIGVKEILFLAIPYGCLFGLGMMLTKLSKRSVACILAFFLSVFLILAIYYAQEAGHFVFSQDYKYPPQLYYLSYSIFMSLTLYLGINFLYKETQVHQKIKGLTNFLVFVSSSSLWIYLWHIFFLKYWKLMLGWLPNYETLIIHPFWVVTLLSIAVTYLQKQLIYQAIAQTRFGQKNSDTLATLFLK